jgi:hypothetical protein
MKNELFYECTRLFPINDWINFDTQIKNDQVQTVLVGQALTQVNPAQALPRAINRFSRKNHSLAFHFWKSRWEMLL